MLARPETTRESGAPVPGKLADYVGVASFEINFCFDPGDDRRCTVDVKSTGNYDA